MRKIYSCAKIWVVFGEMSKEERELKKRQKDASAAQGGLIPALKFAMKHKQLRWLFITATLANLGFIASIDYQVIMSVGNLVSIEEFGDLPENISIFVKT